MSLLYCVDPGTLQSALVIVDTSDGDLRVREACTILNAALLPRLETVPHSATLVLEGMESFGMPVGYEVLETVFWSGRFYEAWPNHDRYRLTRRQVKQQLCNSLQANDANVRAALLDRFGPGKELAIGVKARPGPLYGLKGHEFAALALAVVWHEQRAQRRLEPPAAVRR